MADFMQLALTAARAAALRGEVPVGAVLVQQDQVIASSGNKIEELHDPTAHAEILVLRDGGRALGTRHLTDCDLYVTLEPCAMCAAAISMARIRRLIFAAYDPKGGGVEHGARFYQQPTCHHAPEVIGGINASDSTHILKSFFGLLR